MARSRFVLISALALVACRSRPTAEERTMRPDHAPTPYTAAQIHDACRPGRMSKYMVELAGSDSRHQIFRFRSADAEGAELEISQTTVDGEALGEPRASRSTWTDFQSHASYPKETT
jgi:hypothetical protein